MTSSQRWEQIKEVLEAAIALPDEQRTTYLEGKCGSDVDLRAEVESLITYHEKAGSEFLNVAVPQLMNLSPLAMLPPVGSLLGPYRIIREIGRGGMGVVVMAEDIRFSRKVAIKLITPELSRSEYATARFLREAKLVASLDHPNIARLLDSGTTQDQAPYFVMEFVEGQPICQYCDRQKLSITERLELFCKVCTAVQYAHQQLIIHRDIKPSNVLVTSDGTPKLLDFGIAKILNFDALPEEGDATLTVFRIMTPSYASPEQVKGQAMTTASDVYSLGVVLYELLTGRSPYQSGSNTQEIARAVCDTEPQRPSLTIHETKAPGNSASKTGSMGVSSDRQSTPERHRKRLRGDLDNIVLMALRKEPSRRYPSVEQLREDVRRHLEDLPVVARKDTLHYRTTKFVSRHKAGVVASVVMASALLGGLAITMHEARVARLQRARAERRFNDVRKLANSLIFELHDSIRDLPGTMPARKLLVSRALEYLDSLSQEASGDLALQRELASAYDRLGDVLGYSGAANLGDFSGALQSYKKAIAIREASAAASPNDEQILGDLLSDYFRVSFALQDSGDYAGALDDLQKALPLAQQFVAAHSGTKYQDWLAGFYWQTASVQRQAGDYTHALENYRQAASIRERFAADVHATPLTHYHLGADYIGLGLMLYRTGNLDQGLQTLRNGVHIAEEASAADPSNATFREYLGESYSLLAPELEKHGDLDEALDYNRKAAQIFDELMTADPTNALAKDNFGCVEAALGQELILAGKIQQALPHIKKAVTVFEGVGVRNRYAIAGLAGSYSVMGTAYATLSEKDARSSEKAKHLREAESWYSKSLNAWQQEPDHGAVDPLGGDEASAQVAQKLAKCQAALAELKSVTAMAVPERP